jgi:hypothetical protein
MPFIPRFKSLGFSGIFYKKTNSFVRKESNMFWTIAVILFILWLLGFLGGYAGGGTHSSPAGRCHHRRGDPSYSGTKVMVAIWTVAGEGEVFGEEVISRFRKILPNLLIPSVDKVSQ